MTSLAFVLAELLLAVNGFVYAVSYPWWVPLLWVLAMVTLWLFTKRLA